MKAQISVRTIAENAGVSAMTVSRALRGELNVDPATADRIRAVAESLGYRRNLLVSTVMSTVRGSRHPQCSHIIAFLTVDSAGFPPVQRLASQLYIQGAQQRAAECGFAVEEFVIRPTEADSKKISRILYARNIRGLLVGPLCRSCGHLSLNWKEFASIAISINLVKPDLNRCSVDVVQSVNLAIRNLKRLGYQRIGYAISPLHVALSHHRSRAMYLDYQYLLPPERRVKLLENWSLQGLSSWLKEERPDAVIGHGDEMLSWLNELGVKVPADIGYADCNMFAETNAPIAGVVFDYHSIGATAVDMVISNLLHNVYGAPSQPVHCYVQGKWQDGSTATPRSQSARPAKARKRARVPKVVHNAEPFHPLARKALPSQWSFLNLRKAATHSYRNRKDISRWEHGLGLPLAPGRQDFNAVPFQLIDEKTNGGKGFVLLQDGGHFTLPVGRKCEAVFFLIGAGYVASHAAIAQFAYTWADEQEETHPLVAYYRHPLSADKAESWLSESGVQDWWPSFPQFQNQAAKMVKVGAEDPNPVEWRYLYTLQWINRRPDIDLARILFQHMPNSHAKLAVLGATLLMAD
jgi:LacI family transcriptional regulator